MRILIVTVKVPFARGGAEMLAHGLHQALLAAGHQAEIVQIPFKWYPAERILDQVLACRLLDITESNGTPIDRVIGLRFPAYLVPHPNKVLWLLHQHREAYDLWDHPEAGQLRFHPGGIQIREAIRQADAGLIPEATAVYTISKNVSRRLQYFSRIASQPLYPPPANEDAFHTALAQDYLFFPSRLTLLKRQSLVLEALALTNEPVRIRFAGVPDLPGFDRELRQQSGRLGLDGRVEWLGAISDEEMVRQYAGCLAVVFPPLDEDYGYITLEAMLSSKPVLTCLDSGGPNEFVVHEETGFAVAPDAAAMAAAMDRLWTNRDEAARLGAAARRRYTSLGISWKRVVECLTA